MLHGLEAQGELIIPWVPPTCFGAHQVLPALQALEQVGRDVEVSRLLSRPGIDTSHSVSRSRVKVAGKLCDIVATGRFPLLCSEGHRAALREIRQGVDNLMRGGVAARRWQMVPGESVTSKNSSDVRELPGVAPVQQTRL